MSKKESLNTSLFSDQNNLAPILSYDLNDLYLKSLKKENEGLQIPKLNNPNLQGLLGDLARFSKITIARNNDILFTFERDSPKYKNGDIERQNDIKNNMRQIENLAQYWDQGILYPSSLMINKALSLTSEDQNPPINLSKSYRISNARNTQLTGEINFLPNQDNSKKQRIEITFTLQYPNQNNQGNLPEGYYMVWSKPFSITYRYLLIIDTQKDEEKAQANTDNNSLFLTRITSNHSEVKEYLYGSKLEQKKIKNEEDPKKSSSHSSTLNQSSIMLGITSLIFFQYIGSALSQLSGNNLPIIEKTAFKMVYPNNPAHRHNDLTKLFLSKNMGVSILAIQYAFALMLAVYLIYDGSRKIEQGKKIGYGLVIGGTLMIALNILLFSTVEFRAIAHTKLPAKIAFPVMSATLLLFLLGLFVWNKLKHKNQPQKSDATKGINSIEITLSLAILTAATIIMLGAFDGYSPIKSVSTSIIQFAPFAYGLLASIFFAWELMQFTHTLAIVYKNERGASKKQRGFDVGFRLLNLGHDALLFSIFVLAIAPITLQSSYMGDKMNAQNLRHMQKIGNAISSHHIESLVAVAALYGLCRIVAEIGISLGKRKYTALKPLLDDEKKSTSELIKEKVFSCTPV